MYLVVSDHPLE